MTTETSEGDEQSDDDTAEMPEWMPEEYDPEAPLRERLPIMAEIEGGIELHAQGDLGEQRVVGEPHELTEDGNGNYRLKAGGTFANWNYEIVVPSEAPARLEAVNPDQEVEMYYASRTTKLREIDVRIHGVDTECFDDGEIEA